MSIEPDPSWEGPRVFFDFSIGGRPVGRVSIEIYPEKCPKTCENFRQFCTGEYRPQGYAVGYKDTSIHRIIPGFMIQGGDWERKDGSTNSSIYGAYFDDEPSALSFSEPGIVAMANSGPNTNGSQFFITTTECHELDGQYTAFGRVISGMLVVHKIESVPLKPGTETPSLPVTVSQCGEW